MTREPSINPAGVAEQYSTLTAKNVEESDGATTVGPGPSRCFT